MHEEEEPVRTGQKKAMVGAIPGTWKEGFGSGQRGG